MNTITNPTIEHFVYYTDAFGQGNEGSQAPYESYRELTQDALNHLYGLLGMNPPVYAFPDGNPEMGVSQRLVHTGWEGNGFSFSFEARSYGNAYCLQTAYRSIRSGVDSYVYLKPAIWHPSPSNGLIGESIVLHGAADQNQEALATRVLQEFSPNAFGKSSAISFSHYSAGILGRLTSPFLSIFLYDKSSQQWARSFLDVILLRLDLYRHLSQKQWEIYQYEFRHSMEQVGQNIETLSTSIGQPMGDLRFLESQLSQFSRLSHDYGALLTNVALCRTSIAACGRNIRSLIANPLVGTASNAFETDREWIQFLEDQINADLDFYRSREFLLSSAMGGLETIGSIARARQEERLTLLLALLGLLLATLQAMDDQLAVMIIRAIVGILLVAMGLAWYWFKNRRLKLTPKSEGKIRRRNISLPLERS